MTGVQTCALPICDESKEVPPVTGVAVGADADNTHGHSLAHVADLVLEP